MANGSTLDLDHYAGYGGYVPLEEYLLQFPWWERWLIRRRFHKRQNTEGLTNATG